MLDLRRRQFIMLLSGVAATWPLAARAQQGDQVRRIGVLMSVPEDDPQAQAWLGTFSEGLQQLGWTAGCPIPWNSGNCSTYQQNVRDRTGYCRTGSRSEQWPYLNAGYFSARPPCGDHITGRSLCSPCRLSVQ